MWRWVVAVALLAGPCGAWAGDDAPPVAWERAVPGGSGEPRFAPDGACLVVATEAEILLLDRAGAVRWQRASPSRLLHPDALAVAPDCRWVAAGGDSGYRYAWLIDAHGTGRRAIATHGTPRTLAFSHDGAQLAIGTAAGRLHLAGVPDGTVTERRFEPSGAVIEGIAFGDRHLFVTGGLGFIGRLARDGTPDWTWGAQWLRAVGDRTFDRLLVIDSPPHFSDVDGVALLGGDGKVLWETRLHAAEAVLAIDGSRAVVKGGPVSDDETQSDVPPVEITLDHDGHELGRRPAEPGVLVALAPDCRSRITLHVGRFREPGRDRDTLVCRSEAGDVLWRLSDVPLPPTFSPDGRLMVVHTDRTLRAFAIDAPQAGR